MRSRSTNAARHNADGRGDTTRGSHIISNVPQAAERTAKERQTKYKRGINSLSTLCVRARNYRETERERETCII